MSALTAEVAIEPRVCPTCGEPIVRGFLESYYDFAIRRYCGPTCARARPRLTKARVQRAKTRTCRTCGEPKPLDAFPAPDPVDKRKMAHKLRVCLACHAAAEKARELARQTRRLPVKPDTATLATTAKGWPSMAPEACLYPLERHWSATECLALATELKKAGIDGLVRGYVATVGLAAEGMVLPRFPSARQAAMFEEMLETRARRRERGR